MAGIDYLRAIQRGELPPAPIAGLLDFEVSEVEEGRVSFTCRPDESAYNPIGVVHGGLVCTLLDSVTACAVHSTLPLGRATPRSRSRSATCARSPPAAAC